MYNQIVAIIEAHRGIFGRELVLIMISDACPHTLNEEKYAEALYQLIYSGNIVALPFMINDVVDSVYFPKGTVLL
jgi:hypothetical protein